MITRRGLLTLAGGAIVSIVAAVGYPLSEVFARPRITRYRVAPHDWPAGLRLRACVVADLHACDPWMDLQRVRSICTQVQDLNPDIILLLGDYVSAMPEISHRVAPSDWAAALGGLSAPLGVHAVLGNHDYWVDEAFQQDPANTPLVARELENAGVAVHINRAIAIEKDGLRFWLAGLGDQMALLPGAQYGRAQMRGVDDLEATLADVKDDAPVLLLAHEPDVFDSVDERVTLTLSGHTHGGQINLFGWRPVSASPGSALYPAGVFQGASGHLVVSRGLGCSGFPVRIGSHPELLLVEVESPAEFSGLPAERLSYEQM